MDETKKLSMASKRVLAEQTRAFMSLSPDESRNAIDALLKTYQLEIESLSRRCKFSESSFCQLSNTLSVLPDPSEAKQGDASPGRIGKMQSEMADLEAELLTLKNQDLTVRRLEKRIQEMESQNRIDFQAVETDFRRRVEQTDEKYLAQISSLKQEISTERELKLAVSKQMTDEKFQHEIVLKSSFDEIAQLTVQVENLQTQLVASQSGALSTTASTLYKEMLESSESRISSLEGDLVDIEGKYATSQQRENDLHTRLVQLEKERNEWSAWKQNYQTELATNMNQQKNEIEDKNRIINEYQIRVEKLNSELTVASNTVASNESAKSDGTSTVPLDDAMTSMIQSQRDRLRGKVVELEHERDTLKQSQSELGNRLIALSAEKNKIEAERNFWKQQRKETNGDIELGSVTPPILNKRRNVTVNNVSEIEQHFTSLLVWGLGNPITRRIGVMYLMTLHLLVFMVLYRLSSIVSNSQ